MEKTKALVTSKTFILAVIQALIAMIVVFDTQYPGVGALIMAKSVLDIVLRMMTTSAIGSLISDPKQN